MTSKLTPREILEEVKRRIAAKPESYDQHEFCGIRACIAGHIVAVAKRHKVAEKRGTAYAAGTSIKDEMGEDCHLFEASWTKYPDLARLYRTAWMEDDYSRMAAVGCKAIDRYMKERGI